MTLCTIWSTRLLCTRDSPGKNTAGGCHALLQGSSPPRDQNTCLIFAALVGRFFTISDTWKAQVDPLLPRVLLEVTMAQRLKHLPAMWETWVRSLGQEDPLEKEMATHSSILAWKIPWVENSPTRLNNFTLTFFHFESQSYVGTMCLTVCNFRLTFNFAF